jgi:hypothetical protein
LDLGSQCALSVQIFLACGGMEGASTAVSGR